MGPTIIRRHLKSLLESSGGSEEAKPHSTKEGRIASGERKIKRFLRSRKAKPGNPIGTPGEKPKWKKMPWNPKEKPKMQPLNSGGKATHGYGKAYLKGGRVK